MTKMTKMMNKKEVLKILGMATTNPDRKQVFEDLPKYVNPYSRTRIFKESDVALLMDAFKVVA